MIDYGRDCHKVVPLNLTILYFCKQETICFRIEPGSYLSSIDLKQMYLHVKINENFQQDFGFSIMENGQIQWYYFVVVPFGIESATELMGQLIKPYKHYVHSRSCDLSCYIDDMIDVGHSYLKAFIMNNFIQKVLQMGGWELNRKKSTKFPTTKLLYLGFILDSLTMRVMAPLVKICKVIGYIDELILSHHNKKEIKNRFVAVILGNICHLLQSHGSVLRICTRHSQHKLGGSVTEKDWNGSMHTTEDMVREMLLVKHYLHR